MSRRKLEDVLTLVDRARISCDRYTNILILALDEGGKRPKLTADETETLEDGLTDARDVLQQALELLRD